MQLLVAELAESQQHEQVQSLRDKVRELERDLYYYKKTSRDLKKRLKQSVNMRDECVQQLEDKSAVSLIDSLVKGSTDKVVESVYVQDSLSNEQV